MVKEDLRIGNKLLFSKLGKIVTVSTILFNQNEGITVVDFLENKVGNIITAVERNDVSPIELSFEWIVKLRFLDSGFDFGENFHVYIDKNGVWMEQYGEGREKLEHIKYLHQYQNLHYVLTGKELEVNI